MEHHNILPIETVYNAIADDFDCSRYSVWEGVKDFLNDLPKNSLVGDIGCGNGKNMQYRKEELKYEGCDLASAFITICKNKNLIVKKGDILNIPFMNNYFDYVICIAVIHHLKTTEERKKAIEELLRIVKPNGKILIYVWSFDQYVKEKRVFQKHDEYVPFIKNNGTTFYRYYHLYNKEEFEKDITSIISYKFKIEKIFNDKNNECVVIKKYN